MLQVTIGGFCFAPDSDRSELTVTVEAPPGSSLEYTRVVTEQVARQVRAHPEVAYAYATVGSASGSGGVDVGSVYLRLIPRHQRSVSQQDVANQAAPLCDLLNLAALNAGRANAHPLVAAVHDRPHRLQV